MDIIKRTEHVLPETKQTEEDLVKIRWKKAINNFEIWQKVAD